MAIIDQVIEKEYALYNADCMEVLPDVKSNSVGFSVYSPPFPELYQYSNDPRDMSNCVEYQEGVEQFKYVIDEILRITKPGRLTAVHCMDLKKGTKYQRDFPGDIVRAHTDAGWEFYRRITVRKDPWLIARRTRQRSLMHKMIVQDSTMTGGGGTDQVLIFKKGGENKEPVGHPHGLKTYAGELVVPEDLHNAFKNFTGDQRTNRMSHWIWRRYADDVWDDIRTGRLMPYDEAKENEEEKHVCPLQLDIIERCIELYSNNGDIVFTPFLGVGSEAFQAVSMGRRAIGVELKETYFRQACKNMERASEISIDSQQNIFDMIGDQPK